MDRCGWQIQWLGRSPVRANLGFFRLYKSDFSELRAIIDGEAWNWHKGLKGKLGQFRHVLNEEFSGGGRVVRLVEGTDQLNVQLTPVFDFIDGGNRVLCERGQVDLFKLLAVFQVDQPWPADVS